MEVFGLYPLARSSDRRRDQRLAAGQNGVARGIALGLHDDVIEAFLLPFRLPGRIRRVAPDAAQVASRGADEDRRHAGEAPFALDRVKNFGDVHLPISKRAAESNATGFRLTEGRPVIKV